MIRAQFTRYVIVGLVSNAILYLGYLALTAFGMGHKLAMTVLYVLGVCQTFFFNRSWSFQDSGRIQGAFVKYLAVYGTGYAINWSLLWLFVDELGLPHQVVQGILIFVVAIFIFLLLRFWVFNSSASRKVPHLD